MLLMMVGFGERKKLQYSRSNLISSEIKYSNFNEKNNLHNLGIVVSMVYLLFADDCNHNDVTCWHEKIFISK